MKQTRETNNIIFSSIHNELQHHTPEPPKKTVSATWSKRVTPNVNITPQNLPPKPAYSATWSKRVTPLHHLFLAPTTNFNITPQNPEPHWTPRNYQAPWGAASNYIYRHVLTSRKNNNFLIHPNTFYMTHSTSIYLPKQGRWLPTSATCQNSPRLCGQEQHKFQDHLPTNQQVGIETHRKRSQVLSETPDVYWTRNGPSERDQSLPSKAPHPDQTQSVKPASG